MLLAAENDNRRIPVIIGAPEAQAIAIVLEKINPRRPMTHDLFATFAHAYGVELKEVFIYNFNDGIFSAEMTFIDTQGRQITLDSRTSDAVAVAIRTGAPIYTTPAILEETGIEITEVEKSDEQEEDSPEQPEGLEIAYEQPDYSDMTDEELESTLADAIAADNFEEAAVIQAILEERKKNK